MKKNDAGVEKDGQAISGEEKQFQSEILPIFRVRISLERFLIGSGGRVVNVFPRPHHANDYFCPTLDGGGTHGQIRWMRPLFEKVVM